MVTTPPPSSSSSGLSQLSAEIWHHVFSFFLSDEHPMTIDGVTLRSASRVNKSWKKIVESNDLWTSTTTYDDDDDDEESDPGECDEGGDGNTKKGMDVVSSSSVYRSLQITEEFSMNDDLNGCSGDGSFGSNNGRATLMGFVNLGRLRYANGQGLARHHDDHELQFLVRERSSGRRWILVISAATGDNESYNKPNGCVGDHHSDSLLSELYHSHRMMGEKFLSPPVNTSTENDTNIADRIPQGITSWSGRVVRWYGPISTTTTTTTSATATNRHDIESTAIAAASDLQLPKWKRIDSHKQSLNVMLRHEHDQWGKNPIHGRTRTQRQEMNSTNSNSHQNRHYHRPPFKTWVALIDWMAQICECFDLPNDCLSLSASIFDTYLFKSRRKSVNPTRERSSSSSSSSSSSTYLQLTAGTCVLLASKCKSRTRLLGSTGNGGSSPLLNRRDVALCADNIFTEKEVLLMERSILISLRWKLAILTPLDFLKVFSEPSASTDGEQPFTLSPLVISMSSYILEMVLQSDVCLRYRPSVIAGASILLAYYSLPDQNGGSSPAWSEQSGWMTPIPFSNREVAQAAVSMSRAIDHIRLACPQFSVIKRRFEKLERLEVGKRPIAVLPPITVLERNR